MSVYTIILLACLIAEPTQCRTLERTIADDGSLPPNFLDAQIVCAKWAGEHPQWRVKDCRLLPGRGA